MAKDYLLSAFVTLLVVVDPLSLAPVFVSLTPHATPAVRHRIALNACLIAAGILGGVAIVGDWVLRQLGISLPAFRIAGGLLLFSIAFEMLFGVRIRREGEAAEQAVEEHVRNVAAFPLAIPLMAGPGAITATVLLAGRAGGDLLLTGLVLADVVLVAAACFVAFLFAAQIGRLLGLTGNIVLSRLLGVLLAALAVQYVVDGVRSIIGG
jgi:multiple antibiotic resistance protein